MLVILVKGGSMTCGGIVMVWRAIMVADGGVFSPSIALCGDREEGRKGGGSLSRMSRAEGVGVPIREGLMS